MQFGYVKTRLVKSPAIGTPGSAGIDFFFPEDLTYEQLCDDTINSGCTNVLYTVAKQAMFDADPTKYMDMMIEYSRTVLIIDDSSDKIVSILLPPAGKLFIPSGLKVRIPANHMLLLENKSGVSVKKGLIRGACVVDEDYKGEMHINLFNVSDASIRINAGEKLIQGIIIPVVHTELKQFENPTDLFAGLDSERGTGGFGSTGS